MSLETRLRVRPVPYPEFGGPFFDPKEIEQIQQRGSAPVDLFDFLSSHGLPVIPNSKRRISVALRKRYHLEGILVWDKNKKTSFFPSRNIRLIEDALYGSKFVLLPYFDCGIASFNATYKR